MELPEPKGLDLRTQPSENGVVRNIHSWYLTIETTIGDGNKITSTIYSSHAGGNSGTQAISAVATGRCSLCKLYFSDPVGPGISVCELPPQFQHACDQRGRCKRTEQLR